MTAEGADVPADALPPMEDREITAARRSVVLANPRLASLDPENREEQRGEPFALPFIRDSEGDLRPFRIAGISPHRSSGIARETIICFVKGDPGKVIFVPVSARASAREALISVGFSQKRFMRLSSESNP